jgi:hypothetical protein
MTDEEADVARYSSIQLAEQPSLWRGSPIEAQTPFTSTSSQIAAGGVTSADSNDLCSAAPTLIDLRQGKQSALGANPRKAVTG